MRPSRGGSRGKTTSRGGLRSTDNSGDEASSRKTQRRVRFDDSNSNPSSQGARAAAGAAAGQKPATSAPSASQRTASSNPRRGTSTQRLYNSAVSRAARAPAALSRSFGPAQNASATQSNAPGAVSESFPQRYQNLKKTRERERQEAITNGFLADPDKPRTLAEAITPVGTCPDMCPEFERVERIVQNDVWGPEMESDASSAGQTSSKQQPDESRMVKKFRRAAAGIDEQLPSDLRPPQVLQKTIGYLFNDLVENAESLAAVHHFVWDRTRAIRNDFSIQQITKVSELRIAIDCYERIARFHILSLHQLALPEKPYDKYDAQQEREQLDKTLLSLMQYYDDSRGRLQSPNEPEFRAYCVIFQIQDPIPDLEDRVQSWPENIANHVRVRRALDLYAAACNVDDVQGPLKPLINQPIAQGNWARFWKLVQSDQLSYLMSCVAEIYFPLVRRIALNAVWSACRAAKRNIEDWTLSQLVSVLGFQDQDEVEHFCEQYGFTIKDREDGMAYLDLESVSGRTLPDPPQGTRMQRRSDLVERKRHGRLFSAVISGMSVGAAREAGMIEEYKDEDAEMGDEKSLFITGDSDEEDTQSKVQPTGGMDGQVSQEPKTSALNPFATAWGPANPESNLSNQQKPVSSWPTQSPANQSTFTKDNSASTPFASASTTQSASSDTTQSTQDQAVKGNPWVIGSISSTGGFGSFSKQPEQKTPQAAPNPFSFPQNRPLSSSIASPFDPPTPRPADHSRTTQPSERPNSIFDNPTFTAADGSKASPFNPESKQDDASKPVGKKEGPFSFPRPNVDAANEPSKPSNEPSPFAGFQTKATPNFDPFSSNKSQEAGSKASKSLFDRISDGKNPEPPSSTNPNPAILEPPKFDTPSQISSQPQQSPNTFTFPPSDNRQLSPSTSTPITQSNTSEQLKLPPFQFTNASQTKSPSSPFNSANAPIKSPTTQEKRLLQTQNSQKPAQSQVKSTQQIAQERAAEKAKKSATLDQLARSLVTDPFGFLEQYIEFTVAPMIKAARQQVADEKMQKKADDFRLAKISKRYANRWREISWGRRVARQGRERRQRMARDQSARERRSRESSISSTLEGFKRSINESANGNSPPEKAMGVAGHSPFANQDKKVSQPGNLMREQQSVVEPTKQHVRSQHRRSESAPNRSAILQGQRPTRTPPKHVPSALRNSFLPGDSSVLYQPPLPNSAMRSDTTRSTYFRLKAMGLDPSGLTRTSDRKRPRSSDSDLSPFASPGKRHLTATEVSSPARQLSPSKQPLSIEAPKPAVTDEDEDLFAAVRQARQAMSESISFFHDEIAKEEEMGRSRGSGGSPPFGTSFNATSSGQRFEYASAIGERRSSAGTGSVSGSRAKELPPAYRNRVSKFLPRERYADVRMKQQQRQNAADRSDESGLHQIASSATTPNATSPSERPTAQKLQSQSSAHPPAAPTPVQSTAPNTRDSVFTPDESFNSNISLNSTSPQQRQRPSNLAASSSLRPHSHDPSMTNGSRMSDALGLNNTTIADAKSNGQFAANAISPAQPQSQGVQRGIVQNAFVDVKQGRSNDRARYVHQVEDDSDDDEEVDSFEAGPSNPQRDNAFSLLGSMAMDEADDDVDEEEEGLEVDGYSDEDQEVVTEDEHDSVDEEEDEDDGAGHDEISPPPVRLNASPAPKVTINGKGGTSVEDAIEL